MHIAIDARMYGTAQRGIGRYLMKLIENLEQVDLKNEYTIFLRHVNFEEYQPRNPNFKKTLWDVSWYGWKEQVSGVRCQVSGVDLTHFPHWNVPLLFRRPFIVTIHDLELFSSNRTRESTTRGRFLYWLKHLAFRIVFRHAALSARAIIVPSNVVREQLLDMYPQARKKVHVVHEAPTITTSARYTLHVTRYTPYVLYVGAAYPHKNLPRLLEAWKIVHKEFPEYKLVLVGREDWFWKQLKRSAALYVPPGGGQAPALRDGGHGVIFYGPATDNELAALYQNATLLVQPSLEEGFSLPPLEALSFGCPVAVSDIPVHREILQDAAAFFDPRDVQFIATTLRQLLTDQTTRAAMLATGNTLLSHYSWRTHAGQTLQIYKSIV